MSNTEWQTMLLISRSTALFSCKKTTMKAHQSVNTKEHQNKEEMTGNEILSYSQRG